MQASHVTMSANKLLKRIVASDSQDEAYGAASVLQSDPLAQFAVVFSALIHDVDHTGVPNAQLVLEKAQIATYYNNQRYAI